MPRPVRSRRLGLAALAIATAICVALGARAAVTRRFADHRRWMWRCYLLLCSAVVLRLMGGLAIVTGVTAPWVDPLATWMSWLVPLAAFELREWTQRKTGFFELDRPRPARHKLGGTARFRRLSAALRDSARARLRAGLMPRLAGTLALPDSAANRHPELIPTLWRLRRRCQKST